MVRPKLEVADVFRACESSLYPQLSPEKRRVFRAIINCRTAGLGSHVLECMSCGYREQSYNSCRNRHCPKCQGGKAAEWVDSRASDLLPVRYFHTVFTPAPELRMVAYQNKSVFYELFFEAVAETLRAVAKQHFGAAEIGFFSVLHTWNQRTEYHPHMHVVSPQGGISEDGTKWVAPRGNFFLPVRALSKVFRGKFIELLRTAHRDGELHFYGELSKLENPREFEKLLGLSRRSEWVVYSKKPFGGPEQVLKYLSSYIHRIAISNHRLRELKDGKVTFAYRDSKNKKKKRLLTLPAETFCRRFLLHTIPKGFRRIRHYGFLANAAKREALAKVRTMLNERLPTITAKTRPVNPTVTIKPFAPTCPCCKSGLMLLQAVFNPLSKFHSTDPNQPRGRCPPIYRAPAHTASGLIHA